MKLSPLNFNNVHNAYSCNKKANNYSIKNNSQNDAFVKSENISFASKSTIASKLNGFVPELYEYIMHSKTLSYEGIETVLQKYSPDTLVKPFSEVPSTPNVCKGAGAYFHCNFAINSNVVPALVIPKGKAVYVNIPQEDNIKNRLNLFASNVHEVTHIFQEESSDRLSKAEFISNFLNKTNSPEAKKDTLLALPHLFAYIDTEMQQPYLAFFGMTDWMPRPVKFLNDEGLQMIYKEVVGQNVDEYLAKTILKSLDNVSKPFPHCNKNTLLDYIILTGKNEREAYHNSVSMLKSALKMNEPTDLDYRALLYGRLVKIAEIFKALSEGGM